MATDCIVCNVVSTEELKCSKCEFLLHFKCALGFDPPEEFKNSAERERYTCPPCLVGTSYGLLHLAIDAHSKNPKQLHVPNPKDKAKWARSQRAERRNSQRDTSNNTAVAGAGTDASNGAPVPSVGSAHEASGLNPEDVKRSEKLSIILNTLQNLPKHVNTLLLGDSNTHNVKGKDVDPKGNKVSVRSSGGLCIYAAVHALKNYSESPYGTIQKLIWSIGANDAIHGEKQHCLEDFPQYIESLFTESKRVFPNATVHFILPFIGIRAVKPEFRSDLQRLLKEHVPEVKVHNPPSMTGMMLKDGTHINRDGKRVYINFVMKKFTKSKPGAAESREHTVPTQAPTAPTHTYSGSGQSRNGWEGFRIPHPLVQPSVPPSHVQYMGAPVSFRADLQFPQYPGPQFPQYPGPQYPGLSEALSHTMQAWWRSQQPRQLNGGHLQSWPS